MQYFIIQVLDGNDRFSVTFRHVISDLIELI